MAEKVKGALGSCSFAFGIISIILAVLPLISAWFLAINWLLWIFAVIGLILGIVGIIKNQKKSIAGSVLCVLSVVAYFVLLNSDFMAEKAVEDVANTTKSLIELTNGSY